MKYLVKNVRLLFFALTISGYLNSANVVFDLGGVLVETDSLATWWHVGPMNFIFYASTLNNPFALKSVLYNFLNHIHPLNPEQITTYDDTGIRLPQLMCDWLAGTRKTQDIFNFVELSLKKHISFFNSYLEHRLIHSVAKMIFNPDTFINTRRLIEEGVEFVKECKLQGHQVYVLSNWDAESFEILQQDYPEFIQLFDGVVISGHIGLLKPDPAIYRHLISKHNLNPAECIFIDDQHINIQAAKKFGFRGVICPKKNSILGSGPDFSFVRKHFYSLQSKFIL